MDALDEKLIIDLARQAGFQAGSIQYASGCDSYPFVKPVGPTCLVELKKFAELVVQYHKQAS